MKELVFYFYMMIEEYVFDYKQKGHQGFKEMKNKLRFMRINTCQ